MQCLNGIGKRFEEPGEAASSSTPSPSSSLPLPRPQGVGPQSSPGEHLAGTFSRKSWSDDPITLSPLADPLGLVDMTPLSACAQTRTPAGTPPATLLEGADSFLAGRDPAQGCSPLLSHGCARSLGLPTLLFTWALSGLGHVHGTCLPL